jgi:methylmalonyl-CoA mutase cobalamin-binding subunit
LIRLVGRSQLTMTTQALDDAAERMTRYLTAQSLLNAGVGIAVCVSLWLIGVINHKPFPNPALFGLLAALLRFVPYIGIWIAAGIPLLLSMAVYSGFGVTVEVLGAYVGIEVVAANVFEPVLFGSSTGITGLAVLVSVTFWTWLWGPVGLVLSTPLTVCVVVIGKYVPALSFLNILLSDEPALEPRDRIYQRLLAGDEGEARKLIDEFSHKAPLEEVYDSLLIPVLETAERERHEGNLDEEQLAAIRREIRKIVGELGKPVAEARPEARETLPRGASVSVLCLPAHDESDQIAGEMLAQLLELRGYAVETVSVEQLTSEMVDTAQKSRTDLVCISALPPAAIRHVRYLCKRVHERMPGAEMIVGMWTMLADGRLKERVACAQNVQVVGNLRDALAQAHQIAQGKLVEK